VGAVPAWRLVLRHPAPFLVGRRGGGAFLSDDVLDTEARVPGVEADDLRTLLLPVASIHRRGGRVDLSQRTLHVHAGRLWTPVSGVASRLSRMGRGARAGTRPFRLDFGLWSSGAPFRIEAAPHLCQPHAVYGKAMPDRMRRAVVLDLSDRAAARVRTFAEDEMLHAGGQLYRRVGRPAAFAHGGALADVPDLVDGTATGAVHASYDHYLLPYAPLDGLDAYFEVMRTAKAMRERVLSVVREVGPHVTGIEPDDRDVGTFVNAVPSEILDMLRLGSPGEDLVRAGDPLWAWAVRGAIGDIAGEDAFEALVAARRACEALQEAHPIARHRNRAGLLLRQIDLVARPRLGALRTLPEDDVLSLEGLLPGR
jgi:hypothetical protein